MAKKVKTFTILHFDDEPETVDWIPGKLFEQCVRQYRIQNPVLEEVHDPKFSEFSYSVPTTPDLFHVKYCLVSDFDDMKKQLKTKPDVVILDVLSRDRTLGIDIFSEIVSEYSHLIKRVLFFTGYRDKVDKIAKENDISGSQIFAKPPTSRFYQYLNDVVKKFGGETDELG